MRAQGGAGLAALAGNGGVAGAVRDRDRDRGPERDRGWRCPSWRTGTWCRRWAKAPTGSECGGAGEGGVAAGRPGPPLARPCPAPCAAAVRPVPPVCHLHTRCLSLRGPARPLFARLLAITCHVCAYSSRNPRCSPITCPLFARSTVVECPLCARCSPITCPVRAPDSGPLLALMCALLAHHPLSQPGAPLRAHGAPVCACTPCLLGQRLLPFPARSLSPLAVFPACCPSP